MDYFKLRDKYEIFLEENIRGDSRAIVIISHGFAEHSSRYDYLVNSLLKSRYGVIRYDLRGHGRNKENLGHIDSFEDFILDLEEIYKETIKKYPDKPIFLFGHSMGGLITSLFALNNQLKVNGLILSGPALGLLPSANKINKSLLRLASMFIGKLMIKNPIDKNLCKNEEVYYDYIEDDLVLHKASLKFYYEFLFKGGGEFSENKNDFTYPLLILHGKEDKIVPISLSEDFYKKVKSTDKTFIGYHNLYHEILNEKERDIVIKDIISWLDKRI